MKIVVTKALFHSHGPAPDIHLKNGDSAVVMEVFGIQRVGRYSLRMLAAKAVMIEWAARIHRIPHHEFLEILDRPIRKKQDKKEGQIGTGA